MRVKGSLGSSTYKKITTTTNKERLRERMRKQAQGQVIPLWLFGTLEKEYLDYLRKKKNTHYILIIESIVVDTF